MGERLPELKAQVGGHRTLKVYRENYVCKPLDRRERRFYHTYPASLEPFLPEYAGELIVGSDDSMDEFIMLENLCTGYRKPCVLDLKMGTRMYGDFATEKKRKSQDKKARLSTSGKLGVRLCGYQRYSKSTRSFQRVDKYEGRKVDVEKFQELLEVFFTVGGLLQRSVINSVIHQVENLRRIVLNLDRFRFYSSSLLIVFEGDQPDQGEADREEDDPKDPHHLDFQELIKCGSESPLPVFRKTPVVKLIDFANVTFPGFSAEDAIHEGPDSGLLMGLDNLRQILHTILNRIIHEE